MSAPLHVEVRGRGPDLVLLHGWALHGGMWGPWLDRLATNARLHVVDLPGHGRSGWPTDTRTLADLARLVAPHVPERATVLGWSLGGLVALELARTRPLLPSSLVLIATTPCFVTRDDWPAGMNPQVLQGFAGGLATDHRRTVANFLALQAFGDERQAETLRTMRASLDAHGEPDPAALAAGLDILRTADLRDSLPSIATPTLVVAGERDRITSPAAARELASMLPAARYVEVARAGHAPFLSHPDEVATAVESFLAPAPVNTGEGWGEGLETSEPSPALRTTSPANPGEVKSAASPTSAVEVKSAPSPTSMGAGWGEGLKLDSRRIRASFSAAAAHYDASAQLQAQVRTELLERLDFLRREPASVLDVGAGTGHASVALRTRYPQAAVVAVDLAPGMLCEAGRCSGEAGTFARVAADAAALPFADASVDMVFSNLMLQWCNEPDRVFREFRRVLRPGGVVHFTTFGPDTLVELRRAWTSADPAHAHVSAFLDVHDVGDALVRAGFAEPVLDVERHVLQYADARDLMRDLKAIGAHNATAARARGLTGRGVFGRMLAAYERCRREGRLPATYEVIYAQAWAPEAAAALRGADRREVVVPLSALRRPGA